MGDLSVTVRLNGVVVESRVIPVTRLVRIGESDGAEVAFPGADVVVVRMGDRLALRGRHLEEDEEMDLSLGNVQVALRHTVRARLPSEWAGLVDWRFAAAAVLVTLAGSWVDAAEDWIDRHPEKPQLLIALREAVGSQPASMVVREGSVPAGTVAAVPGAPESSSAALAPPEPAMADGPRHIPDDVLTGIGWYSWYRQAVPYDDQVSSAYERFAVDPYDTTARRSLARAAYDHDEFEESAWHYSWLVERDPTDRHARLRLAWCLKRLGHHTEEETHYQAILEQDPGDVAALGGLAVALARRGRLDEATAVLDRQLAVAPMSPLTHLSVAAISAMQGQDSQALDALERTVVGRRQLTEEIQLELRRDLALEPAFSRLRDDRRTLTLFHRHLAAAAPRPIR